MRNRDREWSYPALRFLGVLFIPPAIASPFFTTIFLISEQLSLSELLARFFSVAVGCLAVTTIPSIVLFLALESLYESNDRIRNSRKLFSSIGGGVGAAMGGGYWVYFYRADHGVSVFIGGAILLFVGLIAGFIAAYVIFPTTESSDTES